MFSRVLVGVDGSAASFHAARFASLVVRPASPDDGLHLVCVTDRAHPPVAAPYPDTPAAERCDLAMASAQAALGRRAVIQSRTVAEPPALSAILQRCEDVDADLLCVGAGTRRLRLGSLSAALIRETPISLAILREGIPSALRIGTIVVGVDASEGSMRAARRMLEWSRMNQAAIHLRCVTRAAPWLPNEGVDLDHERLVGTEAGAALGALWEEADRLGATVGSARVVAGDPAVRLLHEAAQLRADVLVVGSPPKPRLRDTLGSVGARLAAHTSLPLLFVR